MSNLKKGDVCQIDPRTDDTFGGMFFVVTEPRDWGAIGYIPSTNGEVYPYRASDKQIQRIGEVTWLKEDLP